MIVSHLNLEIHTASFSWYESVYSEGYAALTYYGARDIDYDTDPDKHCAKSLESLFESLNTPSNEGHTNELSRFDNNTLTYLSLSTKCRQQDIAGNSVRSISLHTSETLRKSQELILYNINWMIQHGMIEENVAAAEIFHDMEKYIQKCKLKLQDTILLEKNKGRQLGKLEFPAYDGKKKKPEPQLKGYAG